jgi:hypothetical protein
MKKYDNLEVKLELKVIDEDDEFPFLSDFFVEQQIYVNGQLFKGFCELAGLFEDTWLPTKDYMNISDFEEIGADKEYRQQWLSAQRYFGARYSRVYLDSCSCGAPGCAGIWSGVRVYKKKNCFKFSVRKEHGYEEGILGSGKTVLYFTKQNIEDVRKSIVNFYLENIIAFKNGSVATFPIDISHQNFVKYL